MSRRNIRRIAERIRPTITIDIPGTSLLAWRQCPACGSESQQVEPVDADAQCGQCGGRTKRIAISPVPAGGENRTAGNRPAAATGRRKKADSGRGPRPK